MELNRTSWLTGIVLLINQAVFSAVEPTVLPVMFGQYGGSVAVGPQNTLVAWIDYRRTEDMAHEIFGTRVGLLGEPMDGDGVPLCGLVDGQAAVAALRDQFLIAWAKGPNVYARRMSSSGELLDTQPIVVSEKPAHPYPELINLQLTAASDGVSFWVAWTDDRTMPAGTPEYQRYDYQDIYAARISRSGRVLDPRGIRICGRRGNQNTPRLSSRADFIVWNDYRNGKHCIFGSRLSAKGLALDAHGFQIMATTNLQTTAADVSGNGRGWLVVWGDSAAVRGAQVFRSKAVSAPFVIAQTSERTAPQVESAGEDCLVLWQAGASTVGTRVSASKRIGRIVTVASDPSGGAYFAFGSFAASDSRCFVTGTTAALHASWLYNDVWFGNFSPTMFP